MGTNFRGANEALTMGEDVTLPIARLASRLVALLLVTGTALPRRQAWPENSLAAHSVVPNCGF